MHALRPAFWKASQDQQGNFAEEEKGKLVNQRLELCFASANPVTLREKAYVH